MSAVKYTFNGSGTTVLRGESFKAGEYKIYPDRQSHLDAHPYFSRATEFSYADASGPGVTLDEDSEMLRNQIKELKDCINFGEHAVFHNIIDRLDSLEEKLESISGAVEDSEFSGAATVFIESQSSPENYIEAIDRKLINLDKAIADVDARVTGYHP